MSFVRHANFAPIATRVNKGRKPFTLKENGRRLKLRKIKDKYDLDDKVVRSIVDFIERDRGDE